MATKVTKKEKYTLIKSILEGNYMPTDEELEMLKEFCDSETDLLDRKASRVDVKKNAKHDTIAEAIKVVLFRANAPMQCGAIAKGVSTELGEDISLNMTSAILRKMCPPTDSNPNGTGEVVKTIEKKVSYFSLA
jgi:hypothetical protein